MRKTVFAISAFDPIASATRIGPQTLVTSRHSVADLDKVQLHIQGSRLISADVIPSDFPGDLILLKATNMPKGPIIQLGEARLQDTLRVVAIDFKKKQAKIYKEGSINFLPTKEQYLARIHHTAYSQPGNSGGAVVNNSGKLVGIVASGGEGRYEAIPVSQISILNDRSDESHRSESNIIGKSIRSCTLTLEGIRIDNKQKLQKSVAKNIKKSCSKSKNRQLYDLAASTLGQHGFFESSISLYQKSLNEDINSVNSRIGLTISLSLSKKYSESITHLNWLLKNNIFDLQVLRLAIQNGVRVADKGIVNRAFSILKSSNPKLAPIAEKFIKNPPKRFQPSN